MRGNGDGASPAATLVFDLATARFLARALTIAHAHMEEPEVASLAAYFAAAARELEAWRR